MTDFPRCDRALESINNTLQLISWIDDETVQGSTAQKIEELAFATDFVAIEPYDSGIDMGDSEIGLVSFREDPTTEPAVAFLFQALPHDADFFPEHIAATKAPLQLVAERAVTGSIHADAVVDPKNPTGEAVPLITMAHMRDPFAQAIVGVDIFSKLYGNMYLDLPLDCNPGDRGGLAGCGSQLINASMMVLTSLAQQDQSGNTAEWIDTRSADYQAFLANGTIDTEVLPPDASMVAEAIKHEHKVNGIVTAAIRTQASYIHLKHAGASDIFAAYHIGKTYALAQSIE